jgi:colanic acid/amylovoran biosynthesis protein
MNMKIVIRGGGFENKGAEAMLRVVQRELGKRLPAASFHATVSPPEASYAYRSGITPVYHAPSLRGDLSGMVPFAAQIRNLLRSRKNPDFARAVKTNARAADEIHAIGSIQGVVDISGFSYSDAWGTGGFEYAWPWLEHCKIKQKPYLFLPQAWGPFEKPAVARWAQKLCQAADMVVSRDAESSEHLAGLRAASNTRLRQAPDIAFRFHGAPGATGRAVLKGLGIEGDRPVIGIVPNMQVFKRTAGTGGANQYINHLIGLVNYATACLKADVLLVPNEIRVPGSQWPDDRYLCGMIASHVQEPARCFSLSDYFPSETVKALLGQLDLLIASRFHSLVFALSQGIPVLALGWSHKYQELLRPFGLEEFIIDHDKLDTDKVFTITEAAWKNREGTGTSIRNTLPGLQDQVDGLFDEVAAVLSGEHK